MDLMDKPPETMDKPWKTHAQYVDNEITLTHILHTGLPHLITQFQNGRLSTSSTRAAIYGYILCYINQLKPLKNQSYQIHQKTSFLI